MWIVVAYCSIDSSGTLLAIIWIITENINRPIMVMYDQMVVTNYKCVCT